MLNEELNQISVAIRLAENEFETQEEFHYDGTELIEYYSEVAYLSLLTFIDKHNLIGLRGYVVDKWKEYENDLSKSFYSDRGGGDFLEVSTNFLKPVVRALSNIYNIDKLSDIDKKQKFRLPELLKFIPHTATKLNLQITSEDALDKLIEAFLTPLYPDLNSNPALSLPEGYRQPDSSIPSLNLVIEYKFLKRSSDVRSVIDEIQADIRNYAQLPWKYFYVIIGTNVSATTEEKLKETVFKEPSTFERMFLSIVRF